MKEVILLEKQEYEDLTEEIKSLQDYKRNIEHMIKRVYDHIYHDNILVIELDTKKLNKLFYFDENCQVQIIKR